MKTNFVLVVCLLGMLFMGGCDHGRVLNINAKDLYVVNIERQVENQEDSSLYIVAGRVNVDMDSRTIRIGGIVSIGGEHSYQ